MRTTTNHAAGALLPASLGGLETLDARTARQLLELGFDPTRSTYTAEEIVHATVNAALTVNDYLRRAQHAVTPLAAAA